MLWLLAVLAFITLLFPMPHFGLQHVAPNNYIETYASVWTSATPSGHQLRWELGLVGKSFLTAVDAATFQKGADYTPAYPWGRALAILETLLTSTLFALFLLAMRRQFRR
jgi:hypothetical protein